MSGTVGGVSVPRLRLAPSPTGYFHVGNARTALYNWLVTQRTGGTFILRIEDTDTERNREEWVEGIQRNLRWLGVEWDEGPYRQSERTGLYDDAYRRLLDAGKAYYCDCGQDEVKGRNAARFGAKGELAGYDGHCRDRGLSAGVLRFRAPDEGTTVVVDLLRGEPTFDNSTIEDFALARPDGTATFILANVVDDADMRVTHVVRGEEHLPNTPKGLLLWKALAPDLPLPVFAHLPLLVNEKRQKLSKRRDKVAVEDYRDLGILPEALRNYLVLLGWSPGGDREIVSVDEMIDLFRLEDVNVSPAYFDLVKLTAMNAEYIRALDVKDFTDRCQPWLTGEMNPGSIDKEDLPGFAIDRFDRAAFERLAPFVQQRAKLLSEVPAMVDFLFRERPFFDPDSWATAMLKGPARELLDTFLVDVAADGFTWSAEALKGVVERAGEANGVKLGKAQAPIRVATMGRSVGLPLFESLEVLGRDESVARVRRARERVD